MNSLWIGRFGLRLGLFVSAFGLLVLLGIAGQHLVQISWTILLGTALLGGTVCCAYIPSFDMFGPSKCLGLAYTCIAAPALVFGLPFIILEEYLDCKRWPRTVDEAVERLLAEMKPETRRELLGLPVDDLPLLHCGLAMQIRNGFGMWSGNDALLEDCGSEEPDIASWVVVEHLLARLREAAADSGTAVARRESQ